MYLDLGKKLQTLCEQAKRELLLVAPFIKLNAFERLLEGVDAQVKINCVTRWRPDEIALGVSDIEIWQVLQARKYTTLWLRNDLHAKYYRADDNCLIGSANITATALGWATRPNYELLFSASKNEHFSQFEQYLLAGCVEVDQDIFDQTKTVVDSLRSVFIVPTVTSDMSFSSSETQAHIKPETWIPTLRTPEKLIVAYQGKLDELTTAARETATLDLAFLDIPIGLGQQQFEQFVGTLLLQFPIIKQIDDFVSEPRRFGSVRDLLKTLPCASQSNFDANRAWQTLMRWLMYFLPHRYEQFTPRHSEIFSKRRIIIQDE